MYHSWGERTKHPGESNLEKPGMKQELAGEPPLSSLLNTNISNKFIPTAVVAAPACEL